MTVSHTLHVRVLMLDCCVYTCGCVHAVCHDGDCGSASVMLRGATTLAAVVTVGARRRASRPVNR